MKKKSSDNLKSLCVWAMLFFSPAIHAQQFTYTRVDPAPFADNAHHWHDIFNKKNVVNAMPGQQAYMQTEIINIADNILLYQKNNGGWPKNYDIFAILSNQQKAALVEAKGDYVTTFDNGTTFTQIAVLANVYTVSGDEKYKTAALKGLDFILKAQYKNGGWPQNYPLESDYSREITFNDGAYQGIMEMLKDIVDNKPQYAFLDGKYREKLTAAFNKGMDCILKTQINDAGQPTAWCQQYDEGNLKPAWARKFEPPSICNKESADLALFLMSFDHPSKQIVDAIQNAVLWFRDSKIYNTKVNTIAAPRMQTPFRVSVTDRVVVTDPDAPPIWTRYYELKTHRPIFCDRDSKIVYTLAEVNRERRDGYGWYTYSPQQVLNKYPEWQKKWAAENNVLDKTK